MAYRATRTENRVSVGEWTKDLEKGQVLPTEEVPDDVADHLMNHGLLIECPNDAEGNPWYDSDDPELAAVGEGSAKKSSKS